MKKIPTVITIDYKRKPQGRGFNLMDSWLPLGRLEMLLDLSLFWGLLKEFFWQRCSSSLLQLKALTIGIPSWVLKVCRQRCRVCALAVLVRGFGGSLKVDFVEEFSEAPEHVINLNDISAKSIKSVVTAAGFPRLFSLVMVLGMFPAWFSGSTKSRLNRLTQIGLDHHLANYPRPSLTRYGLGATRA
ncbi:hypothetical protein BVC80_1677g22 [Macleaya cordata]|uniref:Uncharacterized protein n=1 Tax=Macleaya cordata TaxID=56857 RepID=A0A200PPR7_MACCD|nr:hypothetical protein BVC80_1677g22 [Macleaya cordata]